MIDECSVSTLFFITGESRRFYARSAAEGIHYQARIVGNRPYASCFRVTEGLFAGILGERCAVFDDFRNLPEVCEAQPSQVYTEHDSQLGDLTGIGRGNENLYFLIRHRFQTPNRNKIKDQILNIEIMAYYQGIPRFCFLLFAIFSVECGIS